MKNNIVTKIVEFLIVVIGLGVWNLVGRVEPSFGWFLSQPVVILTEISIVVTFGIGTFIKVIEIYKNSPQEGDR